MQVFRCCSTVLIALVFVQIIAMIGLNAPASPAPRERGMEYHTWRLWVVICRLWVLYEYRSND